jgi:8-oxo-dGTP pyrophosphatase MutT (NUDIX family)
MVGSMGTNINGRPPGTDRCVAVSVYVLRRRGGATELLFLRRSGGRFAGQWWPVTGTRELAEGPVQCAERELHEETGLSPRSLHDTGLTVPVEGGGHLRIYVAAIGASAAVRTNWEHDAHRWCSEDEAVGVVGEFAAPIVRAAVRVFELRTRERRDT